MSLIKSAVSRETSSVFTADTVQLFWNTFNEQISSAQLVMKELAVEEIGGMKQKIISLQAFATECSTSLLPSYDVKRAQEILEETGNQLRAREDELKPKKKFRFKSLGKVRAAAALKSKANILSAKADSSSGHTSNHPNSESGVVDTSFSVSNHNTPGEVIFLTSEVIGQVDGVIRSLIIRGCVDTTVVARCVLGSVRVENCTNCKIYLGPCRTSVYLDDLQACTMFISSHQLRIHKSRACTLCVRVNSHPIIEDCSGMIFAPYDVQYSELNSHFKLADLESASCWKNVVDFRWHRATASPNWKTALPNELPLARIDLLEDGTTATWGVATLTAPSTTTTAQAPTLGPMAVNTSLQALKAAQQSQMSASTTSLHAETFAKNDSTVDVPVPIDDEEDEL